MLSLIQKAIDKILACTDSFVADIAKFSPQKHRCFGKAYYRAVSEGAAAARDCNYLCYLTDDAYAQLAHLESIYKQVDHCKLTTRNETMVFQAASLKTKNGDKYLHSDRFLQLKFKAQYMQD